MGRASASLLVHVRDGDNSMVDMATDGRRPFGSRPDALVRLLGSLALVGSVLAACSLMQPPTTHGPTAAAGGISKDAAIALALKALPATSRGVPVVVWASIENDPFAPRGNVPPGPLRWVVRLQGGMTTSPCPSGWLDRVATTSDPACLDADGGIDVVLDYYSGAVLGWVH